LSSTGEVHKFEMNDRCAAGTGKFLEIMAQTLETSIAAMGDLALGATNKIQINSLCTVFAESEVVSLIARGEEAGAIALALHEAVASRVVGMASKISIQDKVVFAGGAALNLCLRRLIGEKLGVELHVPSYPQMTGAIGAAILARNSRTDAKHQKKTAQISNGGFA
jgi:predicted CoA-substrate-specific enzyme activase